MDDELRAIKWAGFAPNHPPGRRSGGQGRPQRTAKAERPQAAPADLAGGLAAEARPAVVQTAGTTRPSEFAAAVPRRRIAFAPADHSKALAAKELTSILPR